MGDDPIAEARTPSTPHGKSIARKVPRSKPLKRRSLLGGDSTPRVLIPTDTKSTKDKEMAASFLQYCAMCEKQISHPSNNILYCSEACRRKDSAKPLSASTLCISSPPLSPRATTPMRNTKSSLDYFTTPSTRIPSDIHHFKSDLDPTEWKPKSPRSVSGASEAFRYLSRFHETTKWNPNNNLENDQDCPQTLRHKSTASLSTTTTPMPSLGNTPTTASTSFDSHYDFAFNLRPLPPRQNPLYSASAGHAKGIDLVTPHIPPPIDLAGASSVPNDFDHDFWGKKVVVPGSTPRTKGDGLGALFGKER
ncbi:hypothetical protein LTS15_007017 [Exophiala xenobiotica]|nr:hypothetical protein LTS15_007017 [Exophiala xenobiotica]